MAEVERFPGAYMVMGFLVFCGLFGLCCLFDPNFTNFNDEDGLRDFMFVAVAFVVFTFGSCALFKSED